MHIYLWVSHGDFERIGAWMAAKQRNIISTNETEAIRIAVVCLHGVHENGILVYNYIDCDLISSDISHIIAYGCDNSNRKFLSFMVGVRASDLGQIASKSRINKIIVSLTFALTYSARVHYHTMPTHTVARVSFSLFEIAFSSEIHSPSFTLAFSLSHIFRSSFTLSFSNSHTLTSSCSFSRCKIC